MVYETVSSIPLVAVLWEHEGFGTKTGSVELTTRNGV